MNWYTAFLAVLGISASIFAQQEIHTEKTPQVPAFPGAEGFGMLSRGGRGGQVIFVTNLEDCDPNTEKPIPGSFRAACEAQGPRIIIFRVGGIIEMNAVLKITNPWITIAGQTAPGDGICIKNYPTYIFAHDVIVRYLRFRPGDNTKLPGNLLDALSTTGGSRNVIIDHCSASWAVDEVLSVSGPHQTNITVQWCFITESLNNSVHPKGKHGFGSLIRLDGNVTFHHNLYAHHSTRCPRPGTYGAEPGSLLDFRNNVIYNWLNTAGYSAEDPVRMNYIGNYIKAGPSTRHRERVFEIGGKTTKIYVADNILHGDPIRTQDNWRFVSCEVKNWDCRQSRVDRPFAVAQVTTDSAEQSYEKVLTGAGATLPVRDAVDRRIAEEVRNGTGRIIDTQTDVGGWPEYKSATPPTDSDNDGMPDDWETQNGLNPHDPADANGDNDGEGYTNIEEYLNQTNPKVKDPLVLMW